MKSCNGYKFSIAVVFVCGVIAVGCGGSGGGTSAGGSFGGSAVATVMLANSSVPRDAGDSAAVVTRAGGTGGGPVDISDVQSLTVTVTEIELELCEDGEAEENVVFVRDFEFDPPSITVEQGGTVRWEWQTDTEHSITSGSAGDLDAGSLFDASASGAGSVVEMTFADLGSFPYFSNFTDAIDAGMAGTVEVELDDDSDESAGLGDRSARGAEGENKRIVIFSGAVDVGLLDLIGLSQAITSAEIPAAAYCGIRIRIENPRLVLAADPETEITNVHLTANGRLFVKKGFSLNEGEEVLIVLDFAGMHLVKAGNSGKYVLTPQLKADIEVIDANTSLEGEIVSIDEMTRIIQVQTDTELLDVAIGEGTAISSDDDADDAADTGMEIALAFEDLAVGQNVSIDGLLTIAGPINANTVVIADDDIVTNEVAFEGEIVAVDGMTSVIQVDSSGDVFDVLVTMGTAITTDDDADDADDMGTTVALAFADLAVGQIVSVGGLAMTGLPTEATAIEVADDNIDTTV